MSENEGVPQVLDGAVEATDAMSDVEEVQAEASGEDGEGARTISFPIVGIGASAGGLEAFERFFAQMPPDTGMAFVLVQHLSAPHKSILDDLVQRLTRMKVYPVTDGIEVQPNCAYIIPPATDMALLHGKLHLMEPEASRGLRLPIDYFFRSLAQDQHERAICIVLSGTGTDGTLGLTAIKGEGGMVMVEAPQSAKYDGMPRSAIGTGLADYVLAPEEMPRSLITYVQQAFGTGVERSIIPLSETQDSLDKVFILLRAQTGHDFSYYKQNTIRRRVERRMAVNQIGRLDDYVRYLHQNPLEVEMLFRDLLIGVTRFFRDPEAFEALRLHVLPLIFQDRPPGSPVRVWVPGCSTGEEAYSIAILLREHMDALKQEFKIQVFATDIDKDAIDKARAAIYPDGIVADVSHDRLGRFFSHEGTSFQIKKSIRDLVVFAEQNVIEDPPFSKMDLISCRNLLIYMQADLQKRVLSLFHYSLKPDGFLFLGNSESVSEFMNVFVTVDRKAKLYCRKGDIAFAGLPSLFSRPPFTADIVPPRGITEVASEAKVTVRQLAERALLADYTPACVIVNEKAEVLYIHGHTGPYLELPAGEVSLNLLKMAREGLRLELATALRQVVSRKTPVRFPGLQVRIDDLRRTVDVTVRPVLDPPSMQGLMMVLFEDVAAESSAPVGETTGDAGVDRQAQVDGRVLGLERELRAKDEYLQTTVEELETSNEELQSTNEELQSANEELQSTNEELETSKEELQSVNEELVTINAEHQQNIEMLSRTSNDMNNLLTGTGVGTVFLDHQLIIRRFTPAATQLIHLIHSDIGRPVSHIASNLMGYDRLVEDVQSVLDTLIPVEVQVQTAQGAWYLMRIMPYRTMGNVIEGAVLTFFAITALKRTERALQIDEARYRALLETLRDTVVIVDREGTIEFANRPVAGVEVDAVVGSSTLYDLLPLDARDGLRVLLERVFETGTPALFRPPGSGKHGGADGCEVRLGPIRDEGQVISVVVVATKLTARRQREGPLERPVDAGDKT